MNNSSHAPTDHFTSRVPFDNGRIRAAAVYCSDGRFGEQFDDLMKNSLQLPRYDRLAVPGGAACLARHFVSFREEEGVAEQLRFLIDVHGLQRVVLIAHQDSAFYTKRLKISPLLLKTQQHDDLAKAVKRVQSLGPNLRIDVFFARPNTDKTVSFETVSL
jgi:hypothetical protein